MKRRIPQLKFDAVVDSLVGREEETRALTSALDLVVGSNNPVDQEEEDEDAQKHSMQLRGPQVIVLEGGSGSGKTHLLERWWSSQASPNKIMVRGKFDQQSTTSYGALVEAVQQLLRQTNDHHTLRTMLSHFEDTELQLLTDFIPGIKNLMNGFTSESGATTFHQPSSEFESDSSGPLSVSSKNPTERFAFVLGCCLKMILQVTPPNLVLFIDDLQWADPNSIQLLRNLCANRQLSKILFVLAQRPDEYLEQEFHPSLEKTLQSNGRTLTRLTICDLNVEACNRIVSQVTEQGAEETLELTQLCHAKTHGNPFFLLQFLESLQRRELLVYDLVKFRFVWDIQQLQTNTDLADNVAALVLEGIRALDSDTQHCLRLASRIGFSFQGDDVAFLVEGLKSTAVNKDSNLNDSQSMQVSDQSLQVTASHMERAIAAGLLDDQGEGQYKFPHDQILQSFLGLEGNEDENVALGFLFHSLFRLNPKAKSWALFAALQALKGHWTKLTKTTQLALVGKNCLAAQKAAKKSAFHEAAQYAASALEILQLACRKEDPWKSQFKLCKTAHILAATHALASGKHDDCKRYVEAFLEHTSDLQEQANASYILACSLRNQANYSESIEVLTAVLAKMGEKTKTGVVVRVMNNRKTKNEFERLTDEEILRLPVITDPYDLLKMKLLSTLFLNKYVQYEKEKLWFVLKRLLVLTGQLGLCKYTPLILAAHAYNLANQGDYLGGTRYGEMATQVMDQLKANCNLPIVTFFQVVFVNHLRKPMFSSLPGLKRGFRVGMEHGDSQSAFLCASTDVCYQFMVGNHLKDNCESCADYFRIAQEYGQDQLKKEILLMWQLTANLLGLSENATKFDGLAIGEENLMTEIMTSDDTVQLRYYSKYLMALGGVYLGQWEEASEYFGIVLTYDDRNQLVTSHYSTCFSTVYGAVTWFKVLSKKKDKKLLVKANKALSALRSWVDKGAINIATGCAFAEAQKAAIDQPLDKVKPLFDKAIVGLHRSGLRNLEGLACQCFAEYAIEQEDLQWALDYLLRAKAAYHNWGAMAAVRFLEAKHGFLMA